MVCIPYTPEQWQRIENEYRAHNWEDARKKLPVREVAEWWALASCTCDLQECPWNYPEEGTPCPSDCSHFHPVRLKSGRGVHLLQELPHKVNQKNLLQVISKVRANQKNFKYPIERIRRRGVRDVSGSPRPSYAKGAP
jgi:hypothetical protein